MSTVSATKFSTPETTISPTQTNCMVCNQCERLLKCSRCMTAVYCSKEHQILDWKQHKAICLTHPSTMSSAASSTQYASASNLTNNANHNEFTCKEPVAGHSVPRYHEFTESIDGWTLPITSESSSETYEYSGSRSDEIRIEELIKGMDQHGVHEIKNFAGEELGNSVLKEIETLREEGLFKDGQVVSNRAGLNISKIIRSDKVSWLYGREAEYPSIRLLIAKIDYIVMEANKRYPNSKLGKYKIIERTKAMAACYSGEGAKFVRHVDNPNGDGRRITAIYYLNKDWDVKIDGGMLMIFPTHDEENCARIEPVFDTIVFFWSDKRNPHQVMPLGQPLKEHMEIDVHRKIDRPLKDRYAITVWYYDAEERKNALLTLPGQPLGVLLDREFVKRVLKTEKVSTGQLRVCKNT